MSEPTPDRGTPRAALAAAGLLLAALVGGYFLYVRPSTPAPRPVAGDVLLEERFEVPSGGGVSRRFRVKAPCTVEFRIDPPAGTALRASFGVPAPAVESSPVDAPNPEFVVSWAAKAGDPPHREAVLAPGLYVLRLDSEPGGSREPTHLSLLALPAR